MHQFGVSCHTPLMSGLHFLANCSKVQGFLSDPEVLHHQLLPQGFRCQMTRTGVTQDPHLGPNFLSVIGRVFD